MSIHLYPHRYILDGWGRYMNHNHLTSLSADLFSASSSIRTLYGLVDLQRWASAAQPRRYELNPASLCPSVCLYVCECGQAFGPSTVKDSAVRAIRLFDEPLQPVSREIGSRIDWNRLSQTFSLCVCVTEPVFATQVSQWQWLDGTSV